MTDNTQSDVVDEAQFLCDRLDELDWSQDYEDLANDFDGHVSPPHSRLKKALASLSTKDSDGLQAQIDSLAACILELDMRGTEDEGACKVAEIRLREYAAIRVGDNA